MKAYLLDIPQRLRLKDKTIDANSLLCNKSWAIFNDAGVKQILIFQVNGVLLISTNGVVTTSSWRYLAVNNSIIITTDENTIMYHPVFLDEVVFALQQDGVDACLFMIDERNQQSFLPKTLSELETYFCQRTLLSLNPEISQTVEADNPNGEKKEGKDKQQELKTNKDEIFRQKRVAIMNQFQEEIHEIEERGRKKKRLSLFAGLSLIIWIPLTFASMGNLFLLVFLFLISVIAFGVMILCIPDTDYEVESFIDSKLKNM